MNMRALHHRLSLLLACCAWTLCGPTPVPAQTLQPVIAEYPDRGAGSFTVTNSSFNAMAVVLEPRSFTIDADGNGEYRALDPRIKLELSTTSLRLGPRETQTVFYKATADGGPAWLTVYATFSPLHPGPGITVRVMLPHTIYLYAKQQLTREAIRVDRLEYNPERHQVTCELTNTGTAAGRAESVEASAGRTHTAEGGFPLLPGGTRRLVVPWSEITPPNLLSVRFAGFQVKLPIEQSAIVIR